MKLILCLLSASVLGTQKARIGMYGAETIGRTSVDQEWMFDRDYDAMFTSSVPGVSYYLKNSFLSRCSHALRDNEWINDISCLKVQRHDPTGNIIVKVEQRAPNGFGTKAAQQDELSLKKSEVQQYGLQLKGYAQLTLLQTCGLRKDICQNDERCWLGNEKGQGADTTLEFFDNKEEVRSCQFETGEMMQAPEQSDLPLLGVKKTRKSLLHFNSEFVESKFQSFKERKVTHGRDSYSCECTKINSKVPDAEMKENQKDYKEVGVLKYHNFSKGEWAWWVDITNVCYHDDACKSGTCNFSNYDFKRTDVDQAVIQQYTVSGKCV